MAISDIANSLSTILGNLNPQDLLQLGHKLTQSDQMRALQILTTMQGNPAIAPALLPSLSTIPNLPPRVMSWVTSALAQPADFQRNMSMAVDALQSEATNSGLFSGFRHRTQTTS